MKVSDIPFNDINKKELSIPTLDNFFFMSACNCHIQMPHISIYAVLFQFWCKNSMQSPFRITRKETMHLAKISSKTTYHKCIKDLQEFGFITYIPSFHPQGETKVVLLNVQ